MPSSTGVPARAQLGGRREHRRNDDRSGRDARRQVDVVDLAAAGSDAAQQEAVSSPPPARSPSGRPPSPQRASPASRAPIVSKTCRRSASARSAGTAAASMPAANAARCSVTFIAPEGFASASPIAFPKWLSRLHSISAARSPTSSLRSHRRFDPSREELDDAVRPRRRHPRDAREERARRSGRADVHPRLDGRDQHGDRAHRRADRAGRHRRACATCTRSAAATAPKPTTSSSSAPNRTFRAATRSRSPSGSTPPARSSPCSTAPRRPAVARAAQQRRHRSGRRRASCTRGQTPSTRSRSARSWREDAPDVYRSLSHDILREYREYERMSTTVLNAYVGPRVSRYLDDLEGLLRDVRLRGPAARSCSRTAARCRPRRRNASRSRRWSPGRSAGSSPRPKSARELGYRERDRVRHGRHDREGQPRARERRARHRAGLLHRRRGQRASGDAAGRRHRRGRRRRRQHRLDRRGRRAQGRAAQRGRPSRARSATARAAPSRPSPMRTSCSAASSADAFPRRRDAARRRRARARRSARKIAEPLGLTVEEAALGIIQIAVAEMSLAVRGVSVERGYDPRDFAMVAFGGAGPLHAARDRARAAHPDADRPARPGPLLGARDAARRPAARLRAHVLQAAARVGLRRGRRASSTAMIAEGRALLARRGDARPTRSAFAAFPRHPLRRSGVPDPDAGRRAPISRAAIRRASARLFDELHDRRFGHQAVDEPVEIVNLRLTATGRRERVALPAARRRRRPTRSSRTGASSSTTRRAAVRCADLRPRPARTRRDACSGPAVVWEYASTTRALRRRRAARRAESGELIVRIGAS